MPRDDQHPRRRRWADVVVLIASAYALVAAAWFPPELAAGGRNEAVRAPQWLWIGYAAAGLLGFAAIFIAARYAGLAKAMVAAAGGIMLVTFFALGSITALAVLSLGGTAIAFLAAAAFVGPMPSEREEHAAERRG